MAITTQAARIEAQDAIDEWNDYRMQYHRIREKIGFSVRPPTVKKSIYLAQSPYGWFMRSANYIQQKATGSLATDPMKPVIPIQERTGGSFGEWGDIKPSEITKLMRNNKIAKTLLKDYRAKRAPAFKSKEEFLSYIQPFLRAKPKTSKTETLFKNPFRRRM